MEGEAARRDGAGQGQDHEELRGIGLRRMIGGRPEAAPGVVARVAGEDAAPRVPGDKPAPGLGDQRPAKTLPLEGRLDEDGP